MGFLGQSYLAVVVAQQASMFGPLRALLVIGCVYPIESTKDYFVYAVMTFELCYVCVLIYQAPRNASDFYALGFDTFSSIVEVVSVVALSMKLNISRGVFIPLVEKCFVSNTFADEKSIKRTEIVTFSVFCTFLVLRIAFRSVAFGQLVVVHDIIMGLLYLPIMLFYVIVRHLTVRFSLINDELRTFANVMKSRELPNCHLKSRLNYMFRTHIHLRELGSRISSFLGLFICITIINNVAYYTFSLYYLLITLSDPTKSIQYVDVLVMLTSLTTNIMGCDVCYVCSEKVRFLSFIF